MIKPEGAPDPGVKENVITSFALRSPNEKEGFVWVLEGAAEKVYPKVVWQHDRLRRSPKKNNLTIAI